VSAKVYGVVLFDAAVDELAPLTASWLKRGAEFSYFCAKRIDPNGPYFHMFLESAGPDEAVHEFELQVPHSSVKGILYAADLKRLGFVAPQFTLGRMSRVPGAAR